MLPLRIHKKLHQFILMANLDIIPGSHIHTKSVKIFKRDVLLDLQHDFYLEYRRANFGIIYNKVLREDRFRYYIHGIKRDIKNVATFNYTRRMS